MKHLIGRALYAIYAVCSDLRHKVWQRGHHKEVEADRTVEWFRDMRAMEPVAEVQIAEHRARQQKLTDPVYCPKTNEQRDGALSELLGCGALITGPPDDEGFYDCPECGLFFLASAQDAETETKEDE